MQLTGASTSSASSRFPELQVEEGGEEKAAPFAVSALDRHERMWTVAGTAGPTSLCWSGPTRRRAVKTTHRREVRAELQEVGPAEPGRGNWTLRAWAGGTRVTGETHRGAGTSEKGGKATLDLSKEHMAHPEVRGTVRKILAQT